MKHKNNRKTTKMPLNYIIFTAFVASYVWFYTCHMWVWVQQCRDTKNMCSVDSNFSLWTANQKIETLLTLYVLAINHVVHRIVLQMHPFHLPCPVTDYVINIQQTNSLLNTLHYKWQKWTVKLYKKVLFGHNLQSSLTLGLYKAIVFCSKLQRNLCLYKAVLVCSKTSMCAYT